MFTVVANSLDDYFTFDPRRTDDLKKLDALIRAAAPKLGRYFHEGTPKGSAGMRMKMIGYGRFRYAIKSGQETAWPVIGVALQKNYISVYFSITANGVPIVDRYAGKLGELRTGLNNFSFVHFDDLETGILSALVAEAAALYQADPGNPVRYKSGG